MMEKYNELNRCPKCWGIARSKYLYEEDIKKFESTPGVEYIQRSCNRCGFKWYESPLNDSSNDDFVSDGPEDKEPDETEDLRIE